MRKAKKRRAKLYFLRERTGKSAKLREVRVHKKGVETPATHEVVDVQKESTKSNV